jgi:hypothetical protein
MVVAPHTRFGAGCHNHALELGAAGTGGSGDSGDIGALFEVLDGEHGQDDEQLDGEHGKYGEQFGQAGSARSAAAGIRHDGPGQPNSGPPLTLVCSVAEGWADEVMAQCCCVRGTGDRRRRTMTGRGADGMTLVP